MKRVILDTNFLLMPITLHVDIFEGINQLMLEPYTLCVVEESIKELEAIKARGGREAGAASLALQLLEHKHVEKISSGKQKSLNMPLNSKDVIVDDIIVALSDEDTIVATQDKGLKRRLSEKGVKTIILRNKKRPEFG